VLAVADLVLVPTIPTVLSLRTMVRLGRYLEKHDLAPALAAFLSMADRRKGLHRAICAWAAGHPELFLQTQVPYASQVEQMSVRRTPLGATGSCDPATKAFVALWREVREIGERLGRRPRGGRTTAQALAAWPDAVLGFIATLTEDAPPQTAPAPVAPLAHSPADGELPEPAGDAPCALEFLVRHEEDLAALARALAPSADAPASVEVAHSFDTDEHGVARLGYCLRLVERQGTFEVLLTGHGDETGSAQSPPAGAPRWATQVDAAWAAQVLSGKLSPLEVLRRRLQGGLPVDVQTVLGAKSLRRRATTRTVRRRLGPVPLLRSPDARTSAVFEFERVELPDGRPAHRVRVQVFDARPDELGPALGELFARAGVPWPGAGPPARDLADSDAGHAAAPGGA
jgi:hypothetical protein